MDQVFCSDSLVLIPQSSLKIFPNQNLFVTKSPENTFAKLRVFFQKSTDFCEQKKRTNKDLEIQKVWRLDFSYQKLFCQTSQKVDFVNFFDRLLLTITGQNQRPYHSQFEKSLLLMVQKSGDHQLRLVVYLMIYKVYMATLRSPAKS